MDDQESYHLTAPSCQVNQPSHPRFPHHPHWFCELMFPPGKPFQKSKATTFSPRKLAPMDQMISFYMFLHSHPLSQANKSSHRKKTTTFRTFAPHPHLYSIYVGNVNLTSSGSSFNSLFLRPKNRTPKIYRFSLPHFFQMKSSIPSFGVPRQVAEYPALK